MGEKGLTVRPKLRLQSSLFAKLIGGDPVQSPISFYRDGLFIVGVDGVVASFAENMKAVILKIFYEIASFDGH